MDCWSQWISHLTGVERQDWPIATHAETYWTTNLHKLFRFLDISAPTSMPRPRSAPTPRPLQAQIVARWVPAAYCAFCDYRLDSMTLSVTEKDVTSALVQGDTEQCLEYALAAGWVDARASRLAGTASVTSATQKLAILGLGAPWND